ncbi:MAG TPA: hypothetical protein VLC29_03625 [Rhizomicrobium sp.]|nr:hypothetical protein [Rhizomicrobium sp.]
MIKMFGFAQAQEKRKLRTEVLRAQRALEAAHMQPLAIQQDIARRTLHECVVTMARLSAVKPSREQESLYLLRLAELEQRIKAAESDSDAHELEPSAITAILTQTLLAISSGSRQADGMETIGEKIAQWSRNILPDFDRLQAQLTH